MTLSVLWRPGTSSGLISVSSTRRSARFTSGPSSSDSATQATRNLIRVLGTLAFGL